MDDIFQRVGITLLLFGLLFTSCSKEKSNYNSLTPEEHDIIINKGTEPRNSGVYNKHFEKGIYKCKQCDLPLFESADKFDANSGWPSFDDFIEDNVKVKNEAAVYSEITCKRCNGHLGHLKKGEKFTPKNARYCVNSLSIKFTKTD